jgi:multicomponent Na+:H+ antiporter subunit B
MQRPLESVMLRTMLGPLVSSLQIFAAYVLVHGHYSPGGGFQAGVVLGAAFVLPLLVLGRDARAQGYLTLTRGQATSLSAIGVLIFALVATAPMFFGQPFLDYSALPIAAQAAARRSLGILIIELGVTLGVAGAVVAIFRGLIEYELLGRDAGDSA